MLRDKWKNLLEVIISKFCGALNRVIEYDQFVGTQIFFEIMNFPLV